MATQHEWLVRITLPDGSFGQHRGHYACGADAVLRALDYFEPKSISAMRLTPKTHATHPTPRTAP